MTNNPRTAGIVAFLRRFYAEQKRVSLGRFKKYAANVLTDKECTEIFDYLTCVKVALSPSTKRMYKWICNQDFFNQIAVEEMLQSINLRPKKDVRHKKEEISPKKVSDNEIDLTKVSLDDLVRAIEDHGYEVTLKHIYGLV